MLRNWADNQGYQATKLYYPTTLEQVQERVKRSTKVKGLGTRHSFNKIVNTTGDFISLKYLDRVVELDLNPERPTVTVEAGITCGQLSQYLHREGYALHNLASLPHISVAGACATATHGSGVKNGSLATAVVAMEIVTADGEVQNFSPERTGADFEGMVVGLGGLGIVTKLTLKLLPTFSVRQTLFENLPLAQLKANFEAIVSSAYSVSLFTDWRGPRFNQIWFKRQEDAPFTLKPELFEATPATRNLHPLINLSAENCTEQMGVLGPWHERLPHFRMDHTPSSGQELQTEYFVPRDRALEAFDAIYGMREQIAPLLQISEIRTIAADKHWMSPCYERDSVAIHFTWERNDDAVQELLPKIEERLADYQVRPHWGKLFHMSLEQLEPLYPKFSDFQGLLLKYDPEAKFHNAFLDTHILKRTSHTP